MNKKYRLKIIQSIFCAAIMAMIAFGNFSIIIICFFFFLFVLSVSYPTITKHMRKIKEPIEDKQELIKDILFIVLFYLIMIMIVIYKSIT